MDVSLTCSRDLVPFIKSNRENVSCGTTPFEQQCQSGNANKKNIDVLTSSCDCISVIYVEIRAAEIDD